jgi:hypothetical protein
MRSRPAKARAYRGRVHAGELAALGGYEALTAVAGASAPFEHQVYGVILEAGGDPGAACLADPDDRVVVAGTDVLRARHSDACCALVRMVAPPAVPLIETGSP